MHSFNVDINCLAVWPQWHPCHGDIHIFQPVISNLGLLWSTVAAGRGSCHSLCQGAKSSPGCLNSIHDLNMAHLGTICSAKPFAQPDTTGRIVFSVPCWSAAFSIQIGHQKWSQPWCWLQLRDSECVGISYNLSCKAQHLFQNIVPCHPTAKWL